MSWSYLYINPIHEHTLADADRAARAYPRRRPGVLTASVRTAVRSTRRATARVLRAGSNALGVVATRLDATTAVAGTIDRRTAC